MTDHKRHPWSPQQAEAAGTGWRFHWSTPVEAARSVNLAAG